MTEMEKYKEILKDKLNYFDLNTTQKHWYLHLKKSKHNDFDAIVIPTLEEGIRVWEKGVLYEVTKRDGWHLTLKSVVDSNLITVDEKEVSYSSNYEKKKRKFVLDSLTEEELESLNEVLNNEKEAVKYERSKGVTALDFKKDTVGEKVYEVIQNFSFGNLGLYTRSKPYQDILTNLIIKNREEKIEIEWDKFPRDKRQEFIDLPLLGNVETINDYFNTRYIYMKISLKDYVPFEEVTEDVNKEVLQER